MSKISLSDLAQRLAEKSGISLQEAELFIRKMFDVANEGLQSDKLVKMKWLGTFKVMAVKDRESVDVNTGERIIIEGRDKISFTPDNILKEIVNKPFAQFETVVVNDGVDFDEIDRKFENAEEDGSVFESTLESVPDSENSSLESFVEQDSPVTSGVIDFLDEENDAPVSDEMIVIGEKSLSQENVAEPEEKKPEESEPAATEPAVFKPAVSEPEESESATSELETKESEVPAQNEVESVVSDEENESTLTEETPIAEKIPSDGENSITEIPIEEEASSDEETDKRHVVFASLSGYCSERSIPGNDRRLRLVCFLIMARWLPSVIISLYSWIITSRSRQRRRRQPSLLQRRKKFFAKRLSRIV